MAGTNNEGSREIALRLATAARSVPGIEVAGFVHRLAEELGLPLDAAKLAAVTTTQIGACIGNAELDEAGLEAVRALLAGDPAATGLPTPQPYAEGDLPGSLRLAIASNGGEELNGHFGSCERFLIYQVGVEASRLIDVRSTAETEGAEDRNVARAELIADCNVVYVQSIGGPAAAKVVRAGVHPVKLPLGGPAAEAIARLQSSMHKPPPWLARAMGVEAASLARFTEATEA